jgi:hypothetical protein
MNIRPIVECAYARRCVSLRCLAVHFTIFSGTKYEIYLRFCLNHFRVSVSSKPISARIDTFCPFCCRPFGSLVEYACLYDAVLMVQHARIVSYRLVLKVTQRGTDLQLLHYIVRLFQRISTLENSNAPTNSTIFFWRISSFSSESLKNIFPLILIEAYVKALQTHHHQKSELLQAG